MLNIPADVDDSQITPLCKLNTDKLRLSVPPNYSKCAKKVVIARVLARSNLYRGIASRSLH